MIMNSQLVGLPLSETKKCLTRILMASILATVCSSLVGCSTGDTTQANRGGCIKCVGFADEKNIYDGKTTRFEAAQSAAVQSHTAQSATNQSTSAEP
jgi:hypothetical protein